MSTMTTTTMSITEIAKMFIDKAKAECGLSTYKFTPTKTTSPEEDYKQVYYVKVIVY